MFPIGDENEAGRGPAIVTMAIIAINLLVFFLIQLNDEAFTYGWAAIPFEITQGRDLVGPEAVNVGGNRVEIPQAPGPDPIQLTLLSSMFMHGGFAHIFGNMVFLWVFGDNVEHAAGRVAYLVFYLVAGLVASLAQIFVDPASVIPTLGASGAISGVLGAYIVLFPSNRVHVIIGYFITTVPAILSIGLWAVLQFVNGFGQIAESQETTGGVAYMAHIGGFVAGLVGGILFRAAGAGRRGQAWARRLDVQRGSY
jgi:membrane associated rhomboid family serine protease